jgi:DnaJ-class molecular chaperone
MEVPMPRKPTVDEIIEGRMKIDCIECGGSGVWSFYPDGHSEACVTCKGTGQVYINC